MNPILTSIIGDNSDLIKEVAGMYLKTGDLGSATTKSKNHGSFRR